MPDQTPVDRLIEERRQASPQFAKVLDEMFVAPPRAAGSGSGPVSATCSSWIAKRLRFRPVTAHGVANLVVGFDPCRRSRPVSGQPPFGVELGNRCGDPSSVDCVRGSVPAVGVFGGCAAVRRGERVGVAPASAGAACAGGGGAVTINHDRPGSRKRRRPVSSRQPNERDLWFAAVDSLNAAYRELGNAADSVRFICPPGFLAEIARAKDAINRAKGEIRA